MQISMGYKIVDDKMVEMTYEEKASSGLIREEDIPSFMKIGHIARMETYLSQTDWYAIRFAETGKSIPEEVAIKRSEYRAEISRLQGDN